MGEGHLENRTASICPGGRSLAQRPEERNCGCSVRLRPPRQRVPEDPEIWGRPRDRYAEKIRKSSCADASGNCANSSINQQPSTIIFLRRAAKRVKRWKALRRRNGKRYLLAIWQSSRSDSVRSLASRFVDTLNDARSAQAALGSIGRQDQPSGVFESGSFQSSKVILKRAVDAAFLTPSGAIPSNCPIVQGRIEAWEGTVHLATGA